MGDGWEDSAIAWLSEMGDAGNMTTFLERGLQLAYFAEPKTVIWPNRRTETKRKQNK